MDDSADTVALVHGLSNLNLLDAQAATNTDDSPSKLARIINRAAPALVGIDHVLDTLREVRTPFSHFLAIPPPHSNLKTIKHPTHFPTYFPSSLLLILQIM